MSAGIEQNEAILAAIQNVGGGYVWDAECFAVTLMHVTMADELVEALEGLVGVQQIAMEASNLKLDALMRVARIPGLSSLVLNHSCLDEEEAARLSSIGPEVVYIQE